METSRTLSSVLWSKFIDLLDRHTIKEIAAAGALVVFACLIAGAWINFTAFGNLLIRLSLWHNGAVGKVAIAFVVVFAGKRIGSWLYATLFRLAFTLSGSEPPDTSDTIDGIPATDLEPLTRTTEAGVTFTSEQVDEPAGKPPDKLNRCYAFRMTTLLFLIGILIPHVVAATPPPVDMDKLALAVATAETSDCTAGVGVSRNNCFGMRLRSGPFRTFASKEESYDAFKEMWPRMYGMRLPTRADAIKYTANPEPDRWLAIVYTVYNR